MFTALLSHLYLVYNSSVCGDICKLVLVLTCLEQPMCVWICDDRNNSNANSSYYAKVYKKDTAAWLPLHMLYSKQVKKYL